MTDHIDEPASWRQHNEDRMRRADAWVERSEQEGTEDIERFMFLWIAFNAAYGNETALHDFVERYEKESESHRFETFIGNIVKQDGQDVLEEIVWKEFTGPIRILLNNHYVFQPFWKSVCISGNSSDWQRSFRGSVVKANRALSERDVCTVLSIVFHRLYTLRNQIFHGGATHPSGFGHAQIRDGSRIMASLVPAIIDIMRQDIRNNPDSETWGKVAYPRINAEPE